MKLLLSRLRELGLGESPFTDEQFFTACELLDTTVIWSDKKFAFYFTVAGEHFIVLPKRLRGLRLLFAMAHELSHRILHIGQPYAVNFHGQEDTKDELEADSMALVMMIPKERIRDMAFLDGSRYGSHLWNERVRLYFLHGI